MKASARQSHFPINRLAKGKSEKKGEILEEYKQTNSFDQKQARMAPKYRLSYCRSFQEFFMVFFFLGVNNPNESAHFECI